MSTTVVAGFSGYSFQSSGSPALSVQANGILGGASTMMANSGSYFNGTFSDIWRINWTAYTAPAGWYITELSTAVHFTDDKARFYLNGVLHTTSLANYNVTYPLSSKVTTAPTFITGQLSPLLSGSSIIAFAALGLTITITPDPEIYNPKLLLGMPL